MPGLILTIPPVMEAARNESTTQGTQMSLRALFASTDDPRINLLILDCRG